MFIYIASTSPKLPATPKETKAGRLGAMMHAQRHFTPKAKPCHGTIGGCHCLQVTNKALAGPVMEELFPAFTLGHILFKFLSRCHLPSPTSCLGMEVELIQSLLLPLLQSVHLSLSLYLSQACLVTRKRPWSSLPMVQIKLKEDISICCNSGFGLFFSLFLVRFHSLNLNLFCLDWKAKVCSEYAEIVA